MLIKLHGVRGSLPVSDEKFVKYGGDTTCISIEFDGCPEYFIIDAGTGIRRLNQDVVSHSGYPIHLFLTHVHWDHIIGFPFFKPIYNHKSTINLYGYEDKTPIKGNEFINNLFRHPYFPVGPDAIRAEIVYHESIQTFHHNLFKISTISLCHPDGGVGYKIETKSKTFVFITDNELAIIKSGDANITYQNYVDFCCGADLLIHDAEFTVDEYPQHAGWGHSCISDVIQLALDAKVNSLGLIHHNQERTDLEIDSIISAISKDQNVLQAKLSVFACAAAQIITLA